MKARTYGWKRDLGSIKDHHFVPRLFSLKLPDKVDMRPHCSAVEDQQQEGACTGNMLVGAMEYVARIKGKDLQFSRQMAYWWARSLEHTTTYDAGASIRAVVKGAAKYGICEERFWRYRPDTLLREPDGIAKADATKHKVTEYRRVGGSDGRTALHDVQVALAAGFPVCFGIMCYSSFESDKVANTGYVPMPHSTEDELGGHALLIVGYDRPRKLFIVRNSWGPKWGDAGYCYLPFDYVDDRALSDDFWTITAEIV